MKYDEEWSQGLALSHLRKKCSEQVDMEPEEPMPRVWNTPRRSEPSRLLDLW